MAYNNAFALCLEIIPCINLCTYALPNNAFIMVFALISVNRDHVLKYIYQVMSVNCQRWRFQDYLVFSPITSTA